MRAVVFDGAPRLEHRRAKPEVGPGEALLRIRMAGICKTDLEVCRGYKGFSGILGHEFVADVIESQEPNWTGKRVCAEINVSCGDCSMCRQGHKTHCEKRQVVGLVGRDGAFADFMTIPVQNLHKVPSEISDSAATFIEPLAAAWEITQQIDVGKFNHAVVLGDGKLGQLCSQVLKSAGCRVTTVGKHPEKLDLLTRQDIETVLRGEASHVQPDLVVEATGSESGFDDAVSMVRSRGTVILKSTRSDRRLSTCQRWR